VTRGRSLVIGTILLLSFGVPSNAGASLFDLPAFQTTYDRTDLPVAQGLADRTWIWGPWPITSGIDEPYAESPRGLRVVQYFDKSRMEISDPSGDPSSPWYVTNGLLVVEMAYGWIQTGEGTTEPRSAATQNVAGDQTGDPRSPTYTTVSVLAPRNPRALGNPVIELVGRDGTVLRDESLAKLDVTGAVLVPETNHTVASVFWEFMNSVDLVDDQGVFTDGPLFPNPFYATGFPITEAYWTTIPVGGQITSVLFQCFERRCLTYTPGNSPGWQVEAGNVGRHYYEWRYGAKPTAEVVVYLIDVDAGDGASEVIGCNDVLSERNIAVNSDRGPVIGALTSLLAFDTDVIAELGLYSALSGWDVTVDSVVVDSGHATVELSGSIQVGGACDVPRIRAQLERTVFQFREIATVDFYLNGQPLFDQLS
jgi:Sporulation and spore germination